MAAVKKHKIKLKEVNRHLVCRLCHGYYVDATTIAECLHSFCRSCIIKYLEKNRFCPICEVQIHETKPHLNLRLDKTLQDVVYKLVPGLYHNEMKRRREFYSKHPEQVPLVTPEQCGLEERLIFSPEDFISLSLEYLESQDYETDSISSRSSESGGDNQDGLSFPQQLGLMKLKNEGKNSRRESQDVQDPASHPKRYLQCPANVNISHIKKFIKMKYCLSDKEQVDIIHKRVPLPNHYTLMDVAYIYTWKRSAPMRFFFQINEIKREEKVKVNMEKDAQQENKQRITLNTENPKRIVEEPEIKPSENREPASEKGTSDKIEKTETNNLDSNSITSNGKIINNNNNNVADKIEPSAKIVKKLEEKVNKDQKITASEEKLSDDKKLQQNKICDNKPSEIVKETLKTNAANSKKENEKVKSEVGIKDVKVPDKEPKPKQRDELLLNPYSGKLETVPSKTPETETETKEGNKLAEQEKASESKKSNVNLLKSFRREKSTPNRDNKVQLKVASGDLLTITTTTKRDKPLEKEEANVSIEIKTENKSSEYDFDSTSPPSKISMSLKEYTKSEQFKSISKIGKGPDFRTQNGSEDPLKKEKQKAVPSLYRINTEQNKKSVQKTPNGKMAEKVEERKAVSPTVINIKTEDQKSEIKMENEKILPPKPIKLENVDAKKSENDKKQANGDGSKKIDTLSPEQSKELLKGIFMKRMNNSADKDAKRAKTETKKNDFGAIDLSRPEANMKQEKNPLENLAEMAKKTGDTKNYDHMVEMLVSAAQHKNIDSLLKIPQYTQSLKYPLPQFSPTQGKNFTNNDINLALKFFSNFNSNLKNQLGLNSQNPQALQFLQQQALLEKRLNSKRPQISDLGPQRKQMKLSPNSEARTSPASKSPPKTSPTKEDMIKMSIDKTMSEIKAQQELQSRMMSSMANYNKSFTPVLQYRQPSIYPPGASSPTKSNQKQKPSSHSPNSQKSTQPNLVPTTSSSKVFDPQLLSEQYVRALSNSNMSFDDSFRYFINTLNQFNMQANEKAQAKQNKEVYHGSPNEGKKSTEHSPPMATAQKT